ncbi:microtubule-associated protein RP/EB family member 1-like isoform X2 [Drosophila serrata]|uniref:microtubule-associated protein RP/EB family member 1-like isoform X2 n=1 Tax=Drosophila serrata TaxID=7274 RepID=UPI000A1D392B|nr:microtubule-associated protein RP/EB family member 1-like isoform X2 [Drosophila serrata]
MNRKVVEVFNTNNSTDHLSRDGMLVWINNRLGSQFYFIEELRTGAAYCQLTDMLFPHQVALHRVKFMTNVEHEFFQNFKILQASFDKIGIKQVIPVEKLIQGRFQDNLQFLQWFKKFYDANCGSVSKDYNAKVVHLDRR